MAEAVVGFVLEQLGELIMDSIVKEAMSLYGVNDQVDLAKRELQQIRCFLRDADERMSHGTATESLRCLVAETREGAQDLEDAIAMFSSEVTARRRTGSGVMNVLKMCVGLLNDAIKLHQVGSKIEKVSARITQLDSRFQAFGLRKLEYEEGATSSSNERQRDLRRTYSHIVEPDVVGFDNDIKELVGYLTSDDNSSRVVSICGMGGLGKTTLARKVYQHRKIRGHFDSLAWASISQQCQVSSVWKEVLLKLSTENKDNIRKMDESEICGELYSIQKERKCLVILDDIWTTETWDRLSPAFPIKDETNSKILLTTRNRDPASYADGDGIIHNPRCLNDDDSWELFQKILRRPAQSSLEDGQIKERLGQQMLKHCAGLPLAITVLGGLLSRKETVLEWEIVSKNVKKHISEGKGKDLHDSKYSGISWVLGLSYDELPFYLKLCFLYLASFPEDHEIRVDELCKLWMAEGFISSEEMGYDYLCELVQRCMVQRVVLDSINKRIRTCWVHDLMRDLCLSKSHEENFLQIVSFSKQHGAMDTLASTKVRRVTMVSLNGGSIGDHNLMPIIKDGCLRSFICSSQSLGLITLKPWINYFHLLKVLKLGNVNSEFWLPKEIGKLIQLRFLSLQGNYSMKPLLPSITNLACLQTFELKLSSGDIVLKSISKWRLEKLRNLHLPFHHTNFFGDKKLMLENASSLQTLVNISTSYLGFNNLAQLTRLTKLKVRFDDDWQGGVTFSHLRFLRVHIRKAKKRDITPIILSCPQIYRLKVSGGITKLQEHNQFSSNLLKLTLKRTGLKNDPMPTLGKVPKLSILRLVNWAFSVDEIVCLEGSFPRLETLDIGVNFSLRVWRMEEGALPNLCHLSFAIVPGLERFPDELSNITTLKEIELDYMGSTLVNRLKEGGDDFYKFQHVPSLIIKNLMPKGRGVIQRT